MTWRVLAPLLLIAGAGWMIGVDARPGVGARIDAIELASRLREAPDEVRVIDVRGRQAYETFHLPRAEHVTPETVADLEVTPGRTVVVYGGDRATTLKAWSTLRRMGVEGTVYMERAVEDWADRILNPVLPPGASDEERRAFQETVGLARFFGGFPRVGEAVDSTRSAAERLARVRRRGCGF